MTQLWRCIPLPSEEKVVYVGVYVLAQSKVVESTMVGFVPVHVPDDTVIDED